MLKLTNQDGELQFATTDENEARAILLALNSFLTTQGFSVALEVIADDDGVYSIGAKKEGEGLEDDERVLWWLAGYCTANYDATPY